MPNLFFTLDVPANNGVGAATDVSAAGKEKTVQIDGAFRGTLNLEFSVDGGASWITFASFSPPGETKRVIPIAAQLIRVRRLGVPPIAPGLPDIFVSTNDDGAKFATIPLAPASINVESLGSFRTVTATDVVEPTNIQISDDGVKWTTCMTFVGADYKSKIFTSRFMRITKPAVVAVGAVNDAGPDTDELVKVSGNDTTAGFLNGKLVAGANITLTEQNDGANESLEVAAVVPPSSDELVAVSANDTTPGFLNGKLVAGDGVTLTEQNDGGNESLEVAATPAIQSVFENTSDSTNSTTFVNALNGDFIEIPEDGNYLAWWEGTGSKDNATARYVHTVTLDGAELVEATREIRWGELQRTFTLAGSVVFAATAGQQVSLAYRLASGGGGIYIAFRALHVMRISSPPAP